MRKVEKRRLSTPTVLMLVMLGVIALLVTAYIVITSVDWGTDGGDSSGERPELYDYESYYLGKPIAYPQLEESEISYLIIKNDKGNFDMTRWPERTGDMWIGYDKGDGIMNMLQYIPPIVSTENSFDYESLYAIENNDGYGRIYQLTYLMVALGTTYFDSRIELPSATDPAVAEERKALLRQYGVNPEDATVIGFNYADRDAKGNVISEGNVKILLGKQPVSGSGYYFMVEDGNDRNFVYYTSGSYFKYALMGVESFIKGMLVAEGLDADLTYEPYLTTDFKQWVNTRHEQEGAKVEEGSNVLVGGVALVPINAGKDYVVPEGAPTDGYDHGDYVTMSFDLAKLKEHPDYERIRKHLVGLPVGVYYDGKSASADPAKKILLTMINTLPDSSARIVDLSGESPTYSYTVLRVESVITPDREITSQGTAIGEDTLIKVSYYYKINGETASSIVRHAVIDLTDPVIPTAAIEQLKAAAVGDLATPVSFDIKYTEESCMSSTEKVIITDIAGIFDSKGAVVDKITEDSYVDLRYCIEEDGVRGDRQSLTKKLSDIEDDSPWAPLKTLLPGKTKGTELELTVSNEVRYYERLRDFMTYEIWDVDSYITSEMVSSFRFVNASERDPFYGESYYENTIGNSYKLYGLNASSCEQVVKILGGIGTTSNSETVGFSGTTVALGLDHETMEKYGLYAYKIYFELPRGLYDISEGTEADDEDELSDFAWHGTLGFTLYISEEDPVTGNRYVGSDMYDLVAEVDGSQLEFLDFSFVDFWARRNLMLTDVTNLEQLRVELDMEDVYGEYLFDIDVRDVYIGYINGKSVITYDRAVFDEAGVTPTRADQLVNVIYQKGSCMQTKLSEYLAMHADVLTEGGVKLSTLYNYYINQAQGTGGTHFIPGTVDSVGDSNFKELFELLQLTCYEGVVPEDEQAAAMNAPKLMSLHVKLSSSGFHYTYDFHRYSDRKVMVRIYRTNDSGVEMSAPVSDFYVSTFAFKKLVKAVVDVLNAETVDGEIPYAD